MNPSNEPPFPTAQEQALLAALHRPKEIPEAILQQLHAEREALLAKQSLPQPTNIIRPNFTRRWVTAAAAVIVVGAIAYKFIPRGLEHIDIVSPMGEIASTQPQIEWKADPNKKYDLWILPPEVEKNDHLTVKPLLVVRDVTSPVSFSQLKRPKDAPPGLAELEAGREYRVLVCHAGQPKLAGTVVAFKVAQASIPPARKP